MTHQLAEFESALLEWLQELHGGKEDVETVQVLIGFREDQFRTALDGLCRRALVVVEGKEMTVTRQGHDLWERLRGPSYRAEQATQRLRQLFAAKTNALVCGGNRGHRQASIVRASINFRLDGHLVRPKVSHQIAGELQEIGRRSGDWIVVFYDAHLIPADLLWQIRSVAQMQRNVVYVFEGSHRRKMIDMVASYEAAFYQQLTVVDLDQRRQARP